jgi:hypothetical protein
VLLPGPRLRHSLGSTTVGESLNEWPCGTDWPGTGEHVLPALRGARV